MISVNKDQICTGRQNPAMPPDSEVAVEIQFDETARLDTAVITDQCCECRSLHDKNLFAASFFIEFSDRFTHLAPSMHSDCDI